MRRLFILREPTERRDRTTDFLLRQVLDSLNHIKRTLREMQQSLTDQIAALNADVAEETTELASIKAYIQGVPALAASAVADALAANNVEEAAAAASIEAARAAVKASIDDTLSAVAANTPSASSGDAGGAGAGGGDTPGQPA